MEGTATTKEVMSDRLIKLLADHQGEIVTYQQINKHLPDLFPRQYIAVVVSKLRKQGFVIVSTRATGYKYLGFRQ